MADKIVEVPGVGQVSFPDTMSDKEIGDAIQTHQLKTGEGMEHPRDTFVPQMESRARTPGVPLAAQMLTPEQRKGAAVGAGRVTEGIAALAPVMGGIAEAPTIGAGLVSAGKQYLKGKVGAGAGAMIGGELGNMIGGRRGAVLGGILGSMAGGLMGGYENPETGERAPTVSSGKAPTTVSGTDAPTPRMIMTPEEVAAYEQRQRLAQRLASERGMRSAAWGAKGQP